MPNRPDRAPCLENRPDVAGIPAAGGTVQRKLRRQSFGNSLQPARHEPQSCRRARRRPRSLALAQSEGQSSPAGATALLMRPPEGAYLRYRKQRATLRGNDRLPVACNLGGKEPSTPTGATCRAGHPLGAARAQTKAAPCSGGSRGMWNTRPAGKVTGYGTNPAGTNLVSDAHRGSVTAAE